MIMPTLDQLLAAGVTLFKWGLGIVIYGFITMLIGLIIITAIAMYSNKSEIKFIK